MRRLLQLQSPDPHDFTIITYTQFDGTVSIGTSTTTNLEGTETTGPLLLPTVSDC